MAREQDQEIVVTVGREHVEVRAGTRQPVSVALACDPTRKETIQLFVEWLCKNERVTTKLVRTLGRHLFDMIFHGAALEELRREFSDPQIKRLRIQLSFDDSAHELAELPWEFMYWERRGGAAVYLATQTSLSLCRYMPLEGEREDLEIAQGELRVLLVVSKPDPKQSELHEVDETAVWEALTTARNELASRQPPITVTVSKLDVPSVGALHDRVKAERPHIVHFLGHGRFTPDGGEVALVDPEGIRVDWCEDEVFAKLVTPRGAPPLLVVLHMCEGAVVDFQQSFRGMAPQLVLHGVPAVVAMQYSIPDVDAQRFSIEFYRRLGEGLPVDAAVQHARFHMYSQQVKRNARGFGTPVLYLHGLDGVIRPPAKAAGSDTAVRDHGVPKLVQSNAPEDPRANGSPSSKVEPAPATQSFASVPQRAERPPESQLAVRVTNAVISKLWEAVRAECELRSYDPLEVSTEVKPIMRADSVENIRMAIRDKISCGFTERFYSVYVRMDGVLDAEKVAS